MIGTKIFLNEFIAYIQLSEMTKVRDSGIFPKANGTTGELLWVNERTEAILTYALCGFANFGALGNMVAGFSQY